MNSMIAVIFVALAVAAVNAGILAPSPLVASPLGVRSVVAAPWSAGVVAPGLAAPWSAGVVTPGLAAPWALSRSVVAPGVLPAAVW